MDKVRECPNCGSNNIDIVTMSESYSFHFCQDCDTQIEEE